MYIYGIMSITTVFIHNYLKTKKGDENMKLSKKVLTLTLAGVMALGSIGPVFAEKPESPTKIEVSFPDLEKGKWYTEAMTDLAKKGILNGEHGLIKPNEPLTRAEYVQILYNIMGTEWEEAIHPDILPGSMDDIKDVKEGAWYFKQMRIAMLNGIVNDGYVGKLRPNDPVTREEMFVMTVRAFGLGHWETPEGPEDKAKNFKDEKDISSWSRESINFLLEKDLIKGNQENKLLPKNKMTRAEASMLIISMDMVKELKPEISVK